MGPMGVLAVFGMCLLVVVPPAGLVFLIALGVLASIGDMVK